MRLDLGENKCNYKEVDIGVAAMSALTKSKVIELAKMEFKTDCIKYLSAAVLKLRERSPPKYKLARALHALHLSPFCIRHSLAR